MTEFSDDVDKLVKTIAAQAEQKRVKICVAESCTGGGLAFALTSVAGSSKWFQHGYVCYQNESKVEQLSVKASSLKKHGAVSAKVVEEMACGAIKKFGDIAVGISGIAGPDGGSIDKPVGTVWIALATKNKVKSQCYCFKGNREEVRHRAIVKALEKIDLQLKGMADNQN